MSALNSLLEQRALVEYVAAKDSPMYGPFGDLDDSNILLAVESFLVEYRVCVLFSRLHCILTMRFNYSPFKFAYFPFKFACFPFKFACFHE